MAFECAKFPPVFERVAKEVRAELAVPSAENLLAGSVTSKGIGNVAIPVL